jgi:hypothetical protein
MGRGVDVLVAWVVDTVGGYLGMPRPRSTGTPPRRDLLTEREPGRVPAARSHTPNHYVGLWDRAAGTKEELEIEAAGWEELVRVHFQRNG